MFQSFNSPMGKLNSILEISLLKNSKIPMGKLNG